MSDDVTLGEVNRNLLRLREEVHQGWTNYLTRAEYLAAHQALVDDVADVKKALEEGSSARRALWYVVLGQLIFPIVVGLIIYTRLHP